MRHNELRSNLAIGMIIFTLTLIVQRKFNKRTEILTQIPLFLVPKDFLIQINLLERTTPASGELNCYPLINVLLCSISKHFGKINIFGHGQFSKMLQYDTKTSMQFIYGFEKCLCKHAIIIYS